MYSYCYAFCCYSTCAFNSPESFVERADLWLIWLMDVTWALCQLRAANWIARNRPIKSINRQNKYALNHSLKKLPSGLRLRAKAKQQQVVGALDHLKHPFIDHLTVCLHFNWANRWQASINCHVAFVFFRLRADKAQRGMPTKAHQQSPPPPMCRRSEKYRYVCNNNMCTCTCGCTYTYA